MLYRCPRFMSCVGYKQFPVIHLALETFFEPWTWINLQDQKTRRHNYYELFSNNHFQKPYQTF